MTTVLTGEEFGGLFESFRESAFRLETLDAYMVSEEADEYRRFLAGDEFPKSADNEWVQFVKKCVGEGKTIQRVHTISLPLTPYLRYEINWGYLYTSVAGEDIYLVDRTELSAELSGLTDFWLFDRRTLVMVRYDSAGRFLHGEREDSPDEIKRHANACVQMIGQAHPLRAFLARQRST